ncbi:MAG: hypothetical protein CMH85_08935 [Novosphingobium sp.]|uniref:Uncharacterized protein n=1 Tax=Tsuneonella suprasediminis TaxID=2306996 RepID=A0A419R4Y8_9SPHN|nr:hypothetical protein [Novosphingobium sp.]RJX70343.1 hypothetical protein D6858_02560 [Tsuneonella suprasediminis]
MSKSNHISSSKEGIVDGITAVTVMRSGADYMLCPFFGKCDGLLTVSTGTIAVRFIPNPLRSAERLSDLIIDAGVSRVICGFVPASEQQRLEAAGVDVRLGSCTCGVDQLIVDFADLPKA